MTFFVNIATKIIVTAWIKISVAIIAKQIVQPSINQMLLSGKNSVHCVELYPIRRKGSVKVSGLYIPLSPAYFSFTDVYKNSA